jgi:hypothetical protein
VRFLLSVNQYLIFSNRNKSKLFSAKKTGPFCSVHNFEHIPEMISNLTKNDVLAQVCDSLADTYDGLPVIEYMYYQS